MPKPSPLKTKIIKEALARIESGETYTTVAKSLDIKYGSILKKIILRRGFQPPSRRTISPNLRLPKKKTDLAYIAGLLDGEGCISVVDVTWSNKPARRWHLGITNTNEDVIRWLASFGGYVTSRDRRVGAWKKCFDWNISRRTDLIAILEALLPYMRIKLERARHALSELQAEHR